MKTAVLHCFAYLCLWLPAAAVFLLAGPLAAQHQLTLEYFANPTNLTLGLPNDVALNHYLERSTNLPTFTTHSMLSGHGGPFWSSPFTVTPDICFSSSWYSRHGLGDFDRDGIDDVRELGHPGVLDLLNPAEAGYTNAATGLTWLKEYDTICGRKTPKDEAISRGLTLRLCPPDDLRPEAISRELTLRLYPPEVIKPEAITQGLSFYNGEHAPNPLYLDVMSREISVRLYPPEVVKPGAITREVNRRTSRAIRPKANGAVSFVVGYADCAHSDLLPQLPTFALTHEFQRPPGCFANRGEQLSFCISMGWLWKAQPLRTIKPEGPDVKARQERVVICQELVSGCRGFRCIQSTTRALWGTLRLPCCRVLSFKFPAADGQLFHAIRTELSDIMCLTYSCLREGLTTLRLPGDNPGLPAVGVCFAPASPTKDQVSAYRPCNLNS